MNGLATVSAPIQRAIVVGIVGYFALLGYAQVSGSVYASVAATVVFGAIAVGVGVVLYHGTDAADRTPAVLGAAGCLVGGGLLQFAFLATAFLGPPVLAFDQLSSLLVFVGIGLYVYATWFEA